MKILFVMSLLKRLGSTLLNFNAGQKQKRKAAHAASKLLSEKPKYNP